MQLRHLVWNVTAGQGGASPIARSIWPGWWEGANTGNRSSHGKPPFGSNWRRLDVILAATWSLRESHGLFGSEADSEKLAAGPERCSSITRAECPPARCHSIARSGMSLWGVAVLILLGGY